MTDPGLPLTTGEGNTASHLHPHEPEQPPLLGADGRCFVCALSVSQDEVARLREQLDAARQALSDALDCKGAYNGTVSKDGGEPAICPTCAAAAREALAAGVGVSPDEDSDK